MSHAGYAPFLLQNLLGGKPSPTAQPYAALLPPRVLSSGPLWHVLFLPVHDDDRL
jgi:hypothetical protein